MIDRTKQYTYKGKPVRIYADGSDTYLNVAHGAVEDADGWVVGSFSESDLVEALKFEPKEGDLCFFWDDVGQSNIYVSKFIKKDGMYYYDIVGDRWDNCDSFNGTLPEAFKGL